MLAGRTNILIVYQLLRNSRVAAARGKRVIGLIEAYTRMLQHLDIFIFIFLYIDEYSQTLVQIIVCLIIPNLINQHYITRNVMSTAPQKKNYYKNLFAHLETRVGDSYTRIYSTAGIGKHRIQHNVRLCLDASWVGFVYIYRAGWCDAL